MSAYFRDLEPFLIQLPAMMRKGSQAGKQAGQTLNIITNGASTKEMGHRKAKEERKFRRKRKPR